MQHSFVANDSCWGYMLEPARIGYSLIAILVPGTYLAVKVRKGLDLDEPRVF